MENVRTNVSKIHPVSRTLEISKTKLVVWQLLRVVVIVVVQRERRRNLQIIIL